MSRINACLTQLPHSSLASLSASVHFSFGNPTTQVLNLDFCTLTKLPASLGKLTALTTLDVEGNMYLGDSYREAALDISAQPQFPLQLAGLKALRYLNLNSCELSAVPEVDIQP